MTTDLVKAVPGKLAANMQASTDLKVAILSEPIVQDGLTDVEFRVAKASVLRNNDSGELVVASKLIKAMSQVELMNEINKKLKFIIRNIGIKGWDNSSPDGQYDKTNFLAVLAGYYSDFTFSEVELAFDLLTAGRLDDYLPKDAHKEPNRNHFQSFSSEFIGRVLSAFRVYKNVVWKKATILKPEKDKEYSQEEKNALRASFIDLIYQSFDHYKETEEFVGVSPEFMVVEHLQKSGLVKDINITQRDKRAAVASLCKGSIRSVYDKSKIRKDFEEGNPNRDLDSHSKIKSMQRAVKRAFDKLIKEGKDIRDFVKS